ncbi:MAG: bifunctional nuclease family protein [Gemmatimonadaceae bacterium]|nr:bifunctional nuclease family protein [Gemmatimonadaceae bacterium]
MVEMEVHQVQVSSRAYQRVLLRAKEGVGNLHIVIGPAEARAISLAHRGQEAPRPLSYDMARSLLDEAGASIRQVAITSLQDGIYYAEIHLADDEGGEHVVDSRPSDAIALALRTGAPIFADESVLNEGEASVDGETGDTGQPQCLVSLEELLADSEPGMTEKQQLEKRLRMAIAEEAYEEAARLRDHLNAIP